MCVVNVSMTTTQTIYDSAVDVPDDDDDADTNDRVESRNVFFFFAEICFHVEMEYYVL